jgi:Kef-type K+ transport system membrane component KefB
VLKWLGALGMILYMLLVGSTIDPAPMSRRAGTIAALTLSIVGSTAVLAAIAAAWLRTDGGWQGPDGSDAAFVLALTAGLSAQGVPIVARILEERGLLRTELGAVAIAAGAVVTGLALLASGVAIRGGDRAAGAQLAIVFAAAVAVVAVAAPLARSRWVRRSPRSAVTGLLVIAIAAGIGGKLLIRTVLLGPLIVGIALRNDGHAARFLERRLGVLVRRTLLPIFLGVAALHVNLRELGIGSLLPVLALIAAVVAAKWVASFLSARALGFDPRQSRAMGGLLQCGGVMTVAISLDVLQAGIVTTKTHALLTLSGLLTTLIAGPLLAASGLRRDGAGGPGDQAGALSPATVAR